MEPGREQAASEENIVSGFESHPDGSGMMRDTQTAMPRRS